MSLFLIRQRSFTSAVPYYTTFRWFVLSKDGNRSPRRLFCSAQSFSYFFDFENLM